MDKETAKFMGEMRSDIKWIRENLDKKASKWVEIVMKGAIGTVLLAVLGAILTLVLVGTPTAVAYAYFF